MSESTFQLIALSALIESDRNPRKHFDQVKLGELADSIKAIGVHTPILVRPLPGRRVQDTSADVTHEIIAGARRYRASQMAGTLMIPSVVHEMNDNEALEAAIVENLQRDGLSELDEAEGYEALMTHSGLNADEVGKKIGKSRSYVYTRLKLLDLCEEAREAMRNGLDHSKALLIARVPTHKLQLRAVEELTRKDHRGDTMSVRAASEWLRNNLMLRLDNAVFDIKDAKLVAGAGACGKCPKRTGANPELFSDVGSADVCTDTSCFNDKIQAHTDRIVAAAKKKGLEVIDGEDALKVKAYPGSYMSGYTDVDDKVSLAKGASESLRDQATADELKQIKVLVDPHTHKAIEVVPDDLGYELRSRAHDKHQKANPEPQAQTAKGREKELKAKREALTEKYQTAWRAQAIAAIEPRIIANEVNQFSPGMLRALIFYMSGGFDEPLEVKLLDELLQTKKVNWYECQEAAAALDKVDDLVLGTTLIRWMLQHEAAAPGWWVDGEYTSQSSAPMIEALASVLAIDLNEIKREEQEALRTALANLEEPKPADPPAAQASGVRGGKAGKTKTSAAPAAKKSRTTPEEALQGIATAMQGAEEAAAPTAADPGAADAAQGNEGAADAGGADQGGSGHAPLAGFRVGQDVRFLEGLKGAGGKMRKVSGRAGKIEKELSPGRYSVRFGPAAHEVATADANELELMNDAGPVVQDRMGDDIEVGHRVEVVGDQLTGQWGEVSGLKNGNVLVQIDGLSSDYVFEPAELKSHGHTIAQTAWPFPKTGQAVEA